MSRTRWEVTDYSFMVSLSNWSGNLISVFVGKLGCVRKSGWTRIFSMYLEVRPRERGVCGEKRVPCATSLCCSSVAGETPLLRSAVRGGQWLASRLTLIFEHTLVKYSLCGNCGIGFLLRPVFKDSDLCVPALFLFLFWCSLAGDWYLRCLAVVFPRKRNPL